jgi:uroporphyrin-III C-methyltransferase
MSKISFPGKVIIAGAGPGDPDLLTLRAAQALRDADVVITDRLVSESIVNTHANKKALVLHAGKQRFQEGSTPQYIINELLVEYALQGRTVLRLKGGDVSVFSNLLDELQTLQKYHIPYEIIPGVTAACGAAAFAGIPLTARNYANAVRLLTLHQTGLFDEAYWKDLANTDDTLVFYMSGNNSDELVSTLITNGIAADKYIAVIEQATTPLQQVVSCPVRDYPLAHGNRSYLSPAIIIIGKVVALYESFQWKENNNPQRDHYFKPVQQSREAVERA